MTWYLKTLKAYATFYGRAQRKEFWNFIGISTLGLGLIGYLDILWGLKTTLLSIYLICFFSPTLAVSVRRLHDTGKSGWWVLVNLVPVLGTLLFLFLASQKGHGAVNRYGHPPKTIELIEAQERRSASSSEKGSCGPCPRPCSPGPFYGHDGPELSQ